MIYMDHSATTPVRQEVLEAMLPYFTEEFGNAGTIYRPGSKAKNAIRTARERIAKVIGAKPEEIFFTSGGTESDNWALTGVAESFGEKGNHIITTAIEHPAVLQTCRYLETRGFQVTYLPVSADGFVDPAEVETAIRPETILVSVMTANNEIGTLQPLQEIGRITKEKDILFHTDAVQAYGQIPLNVEALGIDLLSASGHKIFGPKGIGFLYVRKGVKLGSFLHGGSQERSRRAGTENVPGIVGFGKAAELMAASGNEREERVRSLRDGLLKGLEEKIPDLLVNGSMEKRLPGNLNVSFPGVEGETLLIRLDQMGICAASGSACSTGSLEPSHVLTAIGRTPMEAKGSLRLTLSDQNTLEEVEEVVDALASVVEDLRSRSLLYREYRKNRGE